MRTRVDTYVDQRIWNTVGNLELRWRTLCYVHTFLKERKQETWIEEREISQEEGPVTSARRLPGFLGDL